MPSYSGTQSVDTREAAWLTAVDSLPSLLAADGGPWQVVQAFYSRTPATQQTRIFVWSSVVDDNRTSNQRIMPRYEITLGLFWPVRVTTAPLAETEQQNMKDAVDLLVQRIRGPVGDKTHGGAFLSAGEVPRMPGVRVTYEHPWVTIPADKELRGQVVYYVDDFEING